MDLTNSSGYRPEVDGLRAIAIIMVVLYHARLQCSGGFVGVDVFFVISGFLITGLMLKALQNGTFSLVDFWERRIRRIYPALVVMMIGTLLIGAVSLLPLDYVNLGRSAIAQTAMASNFYFWQTVQADGGYFADVSEQMPLLHCWSLAVEEQFYIVFPLFLIFVFRITGGGFCRRRLGVVVLCLALLSFALAEYGSKSHSVATFYLLPSRAWELLVGALLAIAGTEWVPRHRLWRDLMALVGLLAIAVPCWYYSMDTVFPGMAALPPCLGAALIIASNSREKADASKIPTLIGKLLGLRAVVSIGWVSYSWYLWHWPVLVLGKYLWVNHWTPSWFRLGLVLLSLIPAILSWIYIEKPFRARKLASNRAGLFRWALCSTASVLLAALFITAAGGFPSRFSEFMLMRAAAEQDHLDMLALELDCDDIRSGNLIPLGTKGSELPLKLLVWGDSHAIHCLPAIDAICQKLKLHGFMSARLSVPPLGNSLPVDKYHELGLSESDAHFNDATLKFITERRIPNVILAARWNYYASRNTDLLESSLAQTIRTLHAAGCKVWVLMDVPHSDFQTPRQLILANFLGKSVVPTIQTFEAHRNTNSVLYKLSEQSLPATFLDLATVFTEPSSDHYLTEKNGRPLYHDNDHITIRTAKELILPFLEQHLAPALSVP